MSQSSHKHSGACHRVAGDTVFSSTASSGDLNKRSHNEKISSLATTHEPSYIELRHRIHQNPELANQEFKTNALIVEHLNSLEGVEILADKIAYTGVVAVLRGGKPGPTVSLRADIDALPMSELQPESVVPFKSIVENTNHACGHDAHVAMLLGTASVLNDMRGEIPGNVVLYFQPAEEGPPPSEGGGAAMMVEQGACDLFEARPDWVFGLHTCPAPTGYIAMCTDAKGHAMAASCFFEIDVKGVGVHGSNPWMGKDPMPAAATIALATSQIYRQIAADHMLCVSIGQMKDSGGRWNIIPSTLTLCGTIRAVIQSDISVIQEKLEKLAKGTAEAYGIEAEVRFFQDVPALVNTHEWVSEFSPSIERVVGADHIKTMPPQLGYDDISCFINELGGAYFMIGGQDTAFEGDGGIETLHPIEGGKGIGMNHNPMFYFNDEALKTGVEVECAVVLDYLYKKAERSE